MIKIIFYIVLLILIVTACLFIISGVLDSWHYFTKIKLIGFGYVIIICSTVLLNKVEYGGKNND